MQLNFKHSERNPMISVYFKLYYKRRSGIRNKCMTTKPYVVPTLRIRLFGPDRAWSPLITPYLLGPQQQPWLNFGVYQNTHAFLTDSAKTGVFNVFVFHANGISNELRTFPRIVTVRSHHPRGDGRRRRRRSVTRGPKYISNGVL